MKKKQGKSSFKQYFILLLLVGGIAILFKIFLDGNSAFKIESGSSSFGSPVKKNDREVDEAGHTDEFWTNGRFKW